ERLRQPEPWKNAALEADQSADAIAAKGEDVEPGPVADAARGRAKVSPKRRLTIRTRRHEVVGSVAHEAGAEARHGVTSVVFERNGWHGHADVSGEQVDQRVDITRLPCANKFGDERTLGGRVLRGSGFAIVRWP